MEKPVSDDGVFTVAKAAEKLNTLPFYIMNYLSAEQGMEIKDENEPIREEYIKDLYKFDPNQIESRYGDAGSVEQNAPFEETKFNPDVFSTVSTAANYPKRSPL